MPVGPSACRSGWEKIAFWTSALPKRNLEDSPMIRSLTILSALALAATTSMVLAQQGGQPPQPPQPPARGLEMALALEAVQAAVNTCLGEGVKGSAAVVDRSEEHTSELQ